MKKATLFFLFFWAITTNGIAQKITDFEATTITGEKIKFSELKGKIVVVNFWFKACKPCLMEIPYLQKLTEKYKDKNVVFLALCTDSEETLKNFLTTEKFEYKHIANARSIAQQWGVQGYPTNIVIDEKGNIVLNEKGLMIVNGAPKTPQVIDAKIEELLQNK